MLLCGPLHRTKYFGQFSQTRFLPIINGARAPAGWRFFEDYEQARRVAPSKSGDTSPHSKVSPITNPDAP